MKKSEKKLLKKELKKINSKEGLLALLKDKEVNVDKVLADLDYDKELELLQIELVKLQRWAQEENKKVAIIFEGRDAAGKGGSIRRFARHLSPRAMRVVALSKPTTAEQGQWYFQRYVNQLPSKGELVFFDRSWYNRAVVEPVNGFCSEDDYERFMKQVNIFEQMLVDSGLILIKFWFDVNKENQAKRFDERRTNPLKQWKISPVDQKAQQLWDTYTHYIGQMFEKTHTKTVPWVIVDSNSQKQARLEAIRYVLNTIDYEGKKDAKVSLDANADILKVFCSK